ncbi:MAG: 3-dehydroquinate synthase [Alicyclobacillus sp.]|nr:3-dehydroquinate synthase [Alicyclobacillus sp.]
MRTPTARYPVHIGTGLLARVGDLLGGSGVKPGVRALVVTDDHVASLGYADTVAESLAASGIPSSITRVPPGDATKSLAMTEHLYRELLRAGVQRDGLVVAVGGGVVGDLAGFAAATYQRGVRFVQVPTTLLAHDSSIGGKVGVNLAEAKNLVGAFHHPTAVIYDVATLASLPPREWRGGMAEVLKHGIIGDPDLFAALEAEPCATYPGSLAAERMVAQACQVKIRVVEADEHESALRMTLNLGHTFGHAVEHASGYRLNHGEAVAIGICLESHLAVRMGWLATAERDRVVEAFRRHGLPVTPPKDIPSDAVWAALRLDKKHTHGGLTFALPRGIGRVEVARGVPETLVTAVWQEMEERRT